MVAALSSDHKFLTLAVVNATDAEQKFSLNVSGIHLAGNAKRWRMTGKDLSAANHVSRPPEVEMKESAIGEAHAVLSVSPISADIYRFPVLEDVP